MPDLPATAVFLLPSWFLIFTLIGLWWTALLAVTLLHQAAARLRTFLRRRHRVARGVRHMDPADRYEPALAGLDLWPSASPRPLGEAARRAGEGPHTRLRPHSRERSLHS